MRKKKQKTKQKNPKQNNGLWFRTTRVGPFSCHSPSLCTFWHISNNSACDPFTNNLMNNEWELQRERHPCCFLMNWLPCPRQPCLRNFPLKIVCLFFSDFFFSLSLIGWWIGFPVSGLFISVKVKGGLMDSFCGNSVAQGYWNIYVKTALPIISPRVAVNAC